MYVVSGTSAEALQHKLVSSYDIGNHFKYLKIRSAYDKGQRSNRNRYVEDALKFPYIQPNSLFNLKWFVLDIDRNFNIIEIEEKNLPTPNLVVFNKKNGHAHLWYGLEKAIYQQFQFKESKPIKYAKAVYKALCRALDADVNFSQTLCKNPLHSDWTTISMRDEYYTLADLANHLDINWEEPIGTKTHSKKVHISADVVEEFKGVDRGSRNSELFEYVRHKAYKHRMTADCSESDFISWCIECVKQADLINPEPLQNDYRGEKEIEQIGKSIGYWTWTNLDPHKIKASKYDDAARARSLMVRKKAAAKKLKKIERYLKKHPQESNRAISKALGDGFSTDTVNRLVKAIKAKKEAQAAKSRASRTEVVGKVPQDDSISERFVDQVVKAVGLLESGLLPGLVT